jgi:NCAIR mutase (PurE)-related protein
MGKIAVSNSGFRISANFLYWMRKRKAQMENAEVCIEMQLLKSMMKLVEFRERRHCVIEIMLHPDKKIEQQQRAQEF